MTQEISLKQAPVIQYKQELDKIGQSIDKRLKELNIDGQIATIDTLKSLKNLRSDFNKELKEYETQRTGIKKAILKEYTEFELDYEKKIKEKIEKAVETLKNKINFVEDDLRKDKINGIKEYFEELKTAKSIDFVTFEQTGIEITLSTPDKQYKEKCIEFINKVADDLELIETQKDKTEILVEYKTSLNAARSIKTVQERKTAIEEAEHQEKQNQLNKRIQIITELGFEFSEETAIYTRGDDMISYEVLENLSKENFVSLVLSFQLNDPPIYKEPTYTPEGGVIFMDTPKFSAPKISTREYTFKGTDKQFEKFEVVALLNNITISKLVHLL